MRSAVSPRKGARLQRRATFLGQKEHEDSGPGDNIPVVIQRERANENEVTVHDVEEEPIYLRALISFCLVRGDIHFFDHGK